MSNESFATMEKQLSRQPQPQYKNNGAVERKNDITPSRNGRQRRGKFSGTRPQDSTMSMPTVPRPISRGGKSGFDKRPRQRGYQNVRSREEIAEEEEPSYDCEPVYASTSRKGNGNHLLSFQYERPSAQNRHYTHNYGARANTGYKRKTTRYNKEQFLQASYQFVVRDNSSGGLEYVEQMRNPDALVTWDMVELVRNHTTEDINCSICLGPPIAGKITKCGHTYCWGCILHYLSYDESGKQGCPLCHQPVFSDELRSVQHIPVPLRKEKQVIEMKLMRKNKDSVYVCPKAQWKDMKGKPLNIQDGEAVSFNKVIVATGEQIHASVIEKEKEALSVHSAVAEGYEPFFIAMAQELLHKREMDLKERIRSVSHSSCTSTDDDQLLETTVENIPLAPDQSYDGSKIATTYTDAFEDEQDVTAEAVGAEGKERHVSVGEDALPLETLMGREEGSSSNGDSTCNIVSDSSCCEEEDFSQDLEDLLTDVEACSVQDHNQQGNVSVPDSSSVNATDHPNKPPGAQDKTAGRAIASKDMFYFYQDSSGQHIYLNSLNAQCLVKEYGSLENSPDTITGTVVAIDRVFVTEEMRKRFRYLNHIPLTCEIQIVELKLQSPVLSKETLKTFQAQFEKKRKARQRKQKADKMRAKHYEAQHKGAQDHYNHFHIVKSDQYSEPTDNNVEATLNVDVEGTSPDSTNPSSPTVEDENATKSFAQIIKRGNKSPWGTTATAAWPRTPSAPVLAPAKPEAEEEEEEGRPPSYADSMFQAWGNVSWAAPPAKAEESKSPPTAKGKNKKNRKKESTVLFSTGNMARKH